MAVKNGNRSGCAGALAIAAAFAGCSTVPPADPERVRIDYVAPERFTDVGSRYLRAESDRAALLSELRRHLAARASALIPADRTLWVTIADIDMAGAFEPVQQSGYQRVVRNVYPARIELEFRLSASDGSVLEQGKRELRDSMFLTASTLYRDDPLRYEKALLDAWLEREFAAPRG